MGFDQSITILEIQRIIQRFEMGERAGLFHHIHNTMVAIAKISSIAIVG